MACDCINTICIKVFVSPCDTGIDLGLTAPADGDYTFRLGFNGVYTSFVLTLETDDEIIIPNVVNENYNHELQIIEPNGDLLNDTCYSLNVAMTLNAGNGLTPSPSAKGWTIVIATDNSALLTNAFLLTHVISEITTQGQSFLVGVDFTQMGDTVTLLNGNVFFVNQVVKLIV